MVDSVNVNDDAVISSAVNLLTCANAKTGRTVWVTLLVLVNLNWGYYSRNCVVFIILCVAVDLSVILISIFDFCHSRNGDSWDVPKFTQEWCNTENDRDLWWGSQQETDFIWLIKMTNKFYLTCKLDSVVNMSSINVCIHSLFKNMIMSLKGKAFCTPKMKTSIILGAKFWSVFSFLKGVVAEWLKYLVIAPGVQVWSCL